MIKIKNKYFVIIITSLLLGCTHKRVGKDSLVEYRTNKRLDSVATYIDDSILHGFKKKYYKDGITLKDSMPYNMGKKEGLYTSYYPDGKIESKAYFKNNLSNGMTYWYYSNGILKLKGNFINGKAFGDAMFYNVESKIDAYNCRDFYGDNFYLIKYNEAGDKIKEEGLVFSYQYNIAYSSDSLNLLKGDTIKAGQEVSVNIVVATPPKTKTTIRIGEVDKANKPIDLKEYPIVNNVVIYKMNYNKQGEYRWVAIGEIHDIDNDNLINQDTVYRNIVIVK